MKAHETPGPDSSSQATHAYTETLATRLEESHCEALRLRESLVTARLLNQAIGVIMGHVRCTPKQAATMLDALALHRRQAVTDAAAELVYRATGEVPDRDPHFVA